MQIYNFLKKHKLGLVYIPLIVYWIILFTATSLPGRSLPKLFITFGDKLKHFAAYLILAILLSITLRLQNKYPRLKDEYVKYTVVISSIYGIFDEIHQIFIPGRSFDLLDYVADLAGIALGTIVASRFIINKERVASIKKY
ncbi:MAG: teicoplanin resistance protein VanZ [Melioribacteraceae bacterium]|nr:MAG: teicoplanin resistance protein VanZ [Melioribacteraceae bacterium]